MPKPEMATDLDVLIIGGGFGGCYLLKLLRDNGYKTRIVEAAPRLGGVWAWNRYPGSVSPQSPRSHPFSANRHISQAPASTSKYPGTASRTRKSGALGRGKNDFPHLTISATTLTMSTKSGISRKTSSSTLESRGVTSTRRQMAPTGPSRQLKARITKPNGSSPRRGRLSDSICPNGRTATSSRVSSHTPLSGLRTLTSPGSASP